MNTAGSGEKKQAWQNGDLRDALELVSSHLAALQSSTKDNAAVKRLTVIRGIIKESLEASPSRLEENMRLKKELDIVHRYLTEFYNDHEDRIGDKVKECLDEIEQLQKQ